MEQNSPDQKIEEAAVSTQDQSLHEEPPVAGPEATEVPKRDVPSASQRKFPRLVVPGIAVVLALLAVVLFGLIIFGDKPAPPVVVTPTPAPTPTPVRFPSNIATLSAFLALEEKTASLSAAVAGYVVEDPSLTPPVLELPLGLTQ